MGTVVTGAVLAVIVCLIIRKLAHDKKIGKNGCCGDCSRCKGCH